MSITRLVRSLLALSACAAAAAAQIGAPPPEFVGHVWMNSPPMSLEELRGKAVLIEIFRTWEEQCGSDVPGLSAKFDKEQKNGLVVLGISSEEPDAIERWIELRKPTYPIVALKSEEFERALGARGDYFPIVAVIDPRGTLTFSNGLVEGAPESKLMEAMSAAQKGALWPKRFDKVLALIAERQIDKAYVETKKQGAAPLDEAERKALAKLESYLESTASETLADSKRLFDRGRIHEAREQLLPIVRCTPPFPVSTEARELLDTLEAVPNFKNELKAGQAFVEAYSLELGQDFPRAVAQYREILKRNADLKIVSAVQDRLEGLRKRNMLVYVRECDGCIKAKKACAKHAEP